jgi:hypothetical protein
MKLPEPAYVHTIRRGPAAGRPRVVRAIRLAVWVALSAVADAMVAVACHGLTLGAALITFAVAMLTVSVRDGSGRAS